MPRKKQAPVYDYEGEGKKLLNAFKRHLDGYLRPSSVKTYTETVALFMDAIDWNIKRFTTIEADDFVGRFLDGSGNDKTVSAATRNKRIEALNSFAEWLIKPMGILHENPMSDVRKAKKPVRLPTFLSQEDMDKLLDAQHTDTPNGLRDRALLEFLFCTGCRVTEAASLTWDMVDLKQRSIRIIGKGDKERLVYLSDDCVEWLEKYREVAWKEWQAEHEDDETRRDMRHVFVNSSFRPCDRKILYNWISDAGKRARMRIHPHLLRHTFGTTMVREGANIVAVQQLMGHASLSTTQVYVGITERDKQNAVCAIFNKRHNTNEQE